MNKKNNILKIVIVILCLMAVILFSLVAAGVNLPFMQAYKNNFKHNVSGISNILGIDLPIEMQLYLDDMTPPTPKPTMIPAAEQEALENALGIKEEEVVPKEGTAALTTRTPVKTDAGDISATALDSAQNAKFAIMGETLLTVSETRYRAFNKKGELLWEIPIQMQSPQLSVRGGYALINETGAKKLKLYKGKKEVFSAQTEGNIISCDLSEDGEVAAVTEKEFFKGQVVVFNKKGKVIFAWDSGSYNILDAAISSGRSVAVSLLNTDSGADSFVTCFDVDGDVQYKTDNFKNTIIFDVEYEGKRLNAISESKCFGISAKGKTSWEYDYAGKVLTDYGIAQNGSKLLLFDQNGTGEIVVISSGGKVYSPIRTESMPDTVSIKSGSVAYNSGRDAVICDFNGKKILRTSCDSDIKQLHVLDKNETLCVYSDSFQVKKLKRVKKDDIMVISGEEGNE